MVSSFDKKGNNLRVVELIKKLQEIGYDENTKLTFSCTDDETGEYYVIPFEEITYGEELAVSRMIMMQLIFQ